ncbi:MAG: hypothetical protein R6U17_00105 [Thermoplasmata archaeon]
MLDHNKLYLHVNVNNKDAQKFYDKVGFRRHSKAAIKYKGKETGTYLMVRKKGDKTMKSA